MSEKTTKLENEHISFVDHQRPKLKLENKFGNLNSTTLSVERCDLGVKALKENRSLTLSIIFGRRSSYDKPPG